MIRSIYTFLAAALVRALIWFCKRRGRYGFVPQKERHAEVGAREERATESLMRPAEGSALEALARVLGLGRKRYGWWIFALEERDGALRERCAQVCANVNSGVAAGMREAQRASFREWYERR